MARSHARLRDFLPDARALALLGAARGFSCIAAWSMGFRALSDDDYARISIAQRFASAPRLDPSGSSWLPVPFWFYGATFRVFGGSLSVARATAVLLSVGATVGVYVAARLLGAGRWAALAGAALSALIVPYSVLLGVAAVPEVPCAALLLFSATTLSRPEFALRFAGAAGLSVACLMRYEAWPVAATFALFCAWDAIRERRLGLAGCAALALAGAAWWLELGRAEHGDALFFVARVTGYRRALGGTDASRLERLLEWPVALVREAPLVVIALTTLLLLTRNEASSRSLRAGRVTWAMLGLLAFLMWGSVRDGVPTHHAARVLLPLWFFACVLVGHAADRLAQSGAQMMRPSLLVAGGLATLLVLRSTARGVGFAERSLEIEVGAAARRYTHERLAIDTADYGFFAVQAGFGGPVGTQILDDHDPRTPRPSPFESPLSLEERLLQADARFVIATADHAGLLPKRCVSRWTNARFALFYCSPGAS